MSYSGSVPPTIRFVHSKIRWRSSTGTPSSSAIATSGSSAATAVTKSTRPSSIAASMMLAATIR
jgi:hypothetical protein